MNSFEIKLPTFLLAEEPTANIDRFLYIYSPVYMSLILVIVEESQIVLLNEEMRRNPRKSYNYNDETFELIIIQNNVLLTGGQLAPQVSEEVFLDQAWEWWEDYLKWEDKNIDESESSHLN